MQKPNSVSVSLGVFLLLAAISFGGGIAVGSGIADSGKPESNHIDSSVLERIAEARGRYFQTRSEELSRRESVISDREKRLSDRESRFSERQRIMDDRKAGLAEIERLAKSTIEIVNR